MNAPRRHARQPIVEPKVHEFRDMHPYSFDEPVSPQSDPDQANDQTDALSSHDPHSPTQHSHSHYHSSSSANEDFPIRYPRPKMAPPVPVPNLIKKSRGRRVPTRTVSDSEETRPTSRNYVCEVKQCGKRFSRGEHLKRHIRSIHTNEKPFKCPFHSCDKV
ncbi:hypothetical protein SISNIDRAFT_454714 [Sistotremastrum niveocremeum HHB9708]|uniref:C2H2-type domain-containing protein n=1 Tax=Sistotremastrum niveocremeum HHB9708 TaxID=1314777 RepID=A0A164UT05_9AGAM|nr:hypothetical protein SISNIDRAFT_454714 [Sistotremastrum niveocremeum HHB9708]